MNKRRLGDTRSGKLLDTCVLFLVLCICFDFSSMALARSSKKLKANLIASNDRNQNYQLQEKPLGESQLAGISSNKSSEILHWELRTAPVMFLAQWYTFDASYRFSNNLAIGPSLISYNGSDNASMFVPSYKGFAAGMNAIYYLRPTPKTWYIGSHLYHETYKSRSHARSGYDDTTGLKLNGVFGFRWKYNRFVMMLGAGGEVRAQKVAHKKEDGYAAAPDSGEESQNLLLGHVEFKLGVGL